MIKLDLDILMSSLDLDEFEAQVELLPGAKKFYEYAKSIPCDCNRKDCSRRFMQFQLKAILGKDKDSWANFLMLIDDHIFGPLTASDLTLICAKIGIWPSPQKMAQAHWEVYGLGSLEHMTPQGHA